MVFSMCVHLEIVIFTFTLDSFELLVTSLRLYIQKLSLVKNWVHINPGKGVKLKEQNLISELFIFFFRLKMQISLTAIDQHTKVVGC